MKLGQRNLQVRICIFYTFHFYSISIKSLDSALIIKNIVQIRSADAKSSIDVPCISEEKECKQPRLHNDIRSRVIKTYDPQYKIIDFKFIIDGKGRVSIILYLSPGIVGREGQGKMRLKVVDQGKCLERTLLWPAGSQKIKALDLKLQDTHGLRLEEGEIVELTNAVSSSEIHQ